MQSRVVRPVNRPGAVSQKHELQPSSETPNIKTFVRCLRLLDLDQLSDWPGIKENIFASTSAQTSLQARIKAVEWSLYRLFEIYDPKETQTRLRPFFPPLAPLQSLNLRAALYRALTELKRNGTLGRDVVLRKTMLDECKGDKFEEVISTFGLLVLKQVAQSKHPELVEQVDNIPKEYLIPMILSYRHNLQKNLRQRKTISERASSFASRLATEGIELQRREDEVKKSFLAVDKSDLMRLSENVRNSWIGDDRWCDILLEGQTIPGRSLVTESFETNWETSKDQSSDDAPTDLLTNLDERIKQQEGRLKKWKTFHASLLNAQREIRGNPEHVEGMMQKPAYQFDKHQELRMDSQSHRQPAKERLHPYHGSILKNMRNELANLSPTVTSSKPSAKGAKIGISNEPQESAKPANYSEPENQPETVTEGDIYNDRQPSEPESTKTPEMLSVSNPSKITFDDEPENAAIFASSPPRPSVETEHLLAKVGVDLDSYEIESGMEGKEDITDGTLNDRSRVSIFISEEGTNSYIASTERVDDRSDDDSQMLPILPESSARRGTLLERTRQSMSLLATAATKADTSRRSLKQPRLSEAFPVNQFETPGKPQAQPYGARSPRSGSSTPRDKLFSDEADYASVFKSRPRIAVSPLLSPERSNLGLDSMLVGRLNDLNPDDEDAAPERSPIRQG